MTEHKYIIGIDLGTTNSVVAYTRSDAKNDSNNEIKIFKIPQLVDEGAVEPRDILPSFVFVPEEHDVSDEGLALAWDTDSNAVVGEFARNRGEEIPSRLISSAKSWLCHTLVDRNKRVLPWKGPGNVSKMSPVEASSAVLCHIRDAWNHVMAADDINGKIEKQDVYLTVPASFDAVARELTVKAAEIAGFTQITLLEEPQAAFYSWIESSGEDWRQQVKKGDLVLVCDVGGGTSDFSLIRISEEEGDLDLERLSVGQHLLVGGDNMDLALAYSISQKMAEKGTKLDAWQMRGLYHSCRKAKENILNNPDVTRYPVTILGRGSGLIGGTLREDLTVEDIEQVLVKGFFPNCRQDEKPVERKRTGLRELGLSYASDPAITRHLAGFLGMHRGQGEPVEIPDAVLFNGGIMKAANVRKRILDVLSSWQKPEEEKQVKEIVADDYDLSVARGAAYYGLARQGQGIRIRSGLGRSYYVAIESSMPAIPGMPAPLKALCVAAHGMEEGTGARVEADEFVLVVGEPVMFDIMGSTCRPEDEVGTVVEEWSDHEIEDISTIETTLEGEYGSIIPVNIEIKVTEIGTLEFWCVSRDGGQRWKLEFNVRERDDYGI